MDLTAARQAWALILTLCTVYALSTLLICLRASDTASSAVREITSVWRIRIDRANQLSSSIQALRMAETNALVNAEQTEALVSALAYHRDVLDNEIRLTKGVLIGKVEQNLIASAETVWGRHKTGVLNAVDSVLAGERPASMVVLHAESEARFGELLRLADEIAALGHKGAAQAVARARQANSIATAQLLGSSSLFLLAMVTIAHPLWRKSRMA